MAEDYMADGPYEAGNPTPPPAEGEEKKIEGKTALLPLSFFEGKDVTPGTVCSVRVERVQEDQAEVSYVPHSEEESAEGDTAEAEPPSEDVMA